MKLNDKKDRLLESGSRLFLKKGYTQTTLNDIAEDAKVPLGNVYYYYKRKVDILKAAGQHNPEIKRAVTLSETSSEAELNVQRLAAEIKEANI